MYEAVSPRALRWTGRFFALGTAVIIAATIRVASTSGTPLVDNHTWSRTWKLACDHWAEEVSSLLPESKGFGTRPVVYCVPYTDHGERFVRAAGPDRTWGTADDILLFRSTTWR
jgi:hypothetical protein